MKTRTPYLEADRPRCTILGVTPQMSLLVGFSDETSLRVPEDPDLIFEEYDEQTHKKK